MILLRSAIAMLAAAFSMPAQTAPLRVIASNGMKAVILDLEPQIEKAIGRRLAIEFGTTTGLEKKIEDGAPFDVTILTADAIATLAKENKLAAQTNLSRSGIGLAVRKGAPKPDITTAEGLKKALLAAPSITYAADGASRPHLDQMFDRLGIAAEVKPKITLTRGSGPAMQSVAEGKTAVVLTLTSELMTVPGIEIAGSLPADLQAYIYFGAGVGAQTGNAEAAKALIAILTGPAATPVYGAKGMEPVRSRK